MGYQYATQVFGNRKLVWDYDEYYETRGSFAYDTEEETKQAEDEEIRQLESGNWVVLTCRVYERDTDCGCPDCEGWHLLDSLCGIAIENSETALIDYARWSEWIATPYVEAA